MKDAVDVLGPAQLVGVRFLLAGIVLAIIFQKHLKSMLSLGGVRAGAIMGIILFSAFWLQTLGLAYTTPGKNAFLTATYCVMVPLIMWMVSHRFPGWSCIIAAFTCVAGIGLVSIDPGTSTVGFGDGVTLAGAVVFALEIIFISRFTKSYDAIGITILQFICCGILGLFFGFVFEPMPDVAAITPRFYGELAYLVLLSSCVCYVFQNVGLAHVPPAQGSLILSLESVFGVICSVLLYGEQLTPQMIIGFALIFIAILISELAPRRNV